jgi:HEPN domain-containing protein
MNPLTLEWIEKAEGDFETMELAARSRRARTRDGLCFHAQQCAEKYLKACLQEADVVFSKTHNLIDLSKSLLTGEPLPAALRPSLRLLNRYSVALRYPGEFATAREAREARDACRAIRLALRAQLGLAPHRKPAPRRSRK